MISDKLQSATSDTGPPPPLAILPLGSSLHLTSLQFYTTTCFLTIPLFCIYDNTSPFYQQKLSEPAPNPNRLGCELRHGGDGAPQNPSGVLPGDLRRHHPCARCTEGCPQPHLLPPLLPFYTAGHL
ncbi:hypothetical protein ACN38_g3849 [Penicillium nordicum]|uniref:Uncharacterized protein n=1 Tax=Penicillium nordicum TaxID=229535 RepID=A0A0M8PCB4_9EURO|nr:hypothetical protein ACN38_g3849 [Penicillium nordicum]